VIGCEDRVGAATRACPFPCSRGGALRERHRGDSELPECSKPATQSSGGRLKEASASPACGRMPDASHRVVVGRWEESEVPDPMAPGERVADHGRGGDNDVFALADAGCAVASAPAVALSTRSSAGFETGAERTVTASRRNHRRACSIAAPACRDDRTGPRQWGPHCLASGGPSGSSGPSGGSSARSWPLAPASPTRTSPRSKPARRRLRLERWLPSPKLSGSGPASSWPSPLEDRVDSGALPSPSTTWFHEPLRQGTAHYFRHDHIDAAVGIPEAAQAAEQDQGDPAVAELLEVVKGLSARDLKLLLDLARRFALGGTCPALKV
jgi:hypothetical protein